VFDLYFFWEVRVWMQYATEILTAKHN
jgi:hypothetical protein